MLGVLPLATAAAAALIAHERPSAGLLARESLPGAAIVVIFVLRQSGAQAAGLGDLYLLGTVVAGAFGYTLSGRLSRTRPGWEVISLAGGAISAAVGARDLRALAAFARQIPSSAWAGLLYVSFISQFFAFFVFNAAMAIGGVSRIGQLMLLQPFVIVALAAPVNGEPIELVTLAYAAVVVATVAIGQRMRVTRG